MTRSPNTEKMNFSNHPQTVNNQARQICLISHMTSIVSNCAIKPAYRPPAELERQMEPPNPENRPDGNRASSADIDAPPAPATPRRGQHLRAVYNLLFFTFQHSFQYSHFHKSISYLFSYHGDHRTDLTPPGSTRDYRREL